MLLPLKKIYIWGTVLESMMNTERNIVKTLYVKP